MKKHRLFNRLPFSFRCRLSARVSFVSASVGLIASTPAFCQTAPQGETPNFNPDPGATLRTSQPTFYQPPPGTTPDYDKPRDPLLDAPHAPLVPLQPLPMGYKVNEQDYQGDELPPYTKAVPDRWQFHVYTDPPSDPGLLAIPIWKRYNNPDPETPYGYDNTGLFDPYKQSLLKGDLPIANQDTFLAITGNSFTSYEARDIPTPAGVSTANAESSQFYGAGNQQEVDQFLSADFNLFQGETAFQPIGWQILIEPVYNINYSEVKQTGVLSVDPRGSGQQSDNTGVFTNTVGVQSSPIVANLTPVQIAGLKPGNPTLTNIGGSGSGSGTVPSTGIDLQHVGAQSLNTSYITRTKDFLALQEAFGEVKIADLTPNYDFVSVRAGNQPFISDFRGFIFDDTDLGVRVFGNYDSNRWQYNMAVFDMREKDTYSGLNTFDSRHQWVFAANVYRQDFFAKGYTAQLSFLTDFDNQTTHYDRTGNLVDPEVLGGPIQPHDIRAYYLGWNGDGHIGRFNITHSFYEVVGHDDFNGLAGHGVDINAQMGALELSYDESWIRFKASFFYGSGDDKPTSNTATGFDSIMDNPEFAGGPFSYFVRQGFEFGDTAVGFKQSNSLLIDLRSSKTEGQANFVNPGVLLYGIGSDIDLTPTAKLFLNANYIQMATNESVNYALHTNNIGRDIGWDLSGGVKYRPLLTNNIILSAGLGALVPSNAYKRIYSSNTTEIPGYDTIPQNHIDSFLYSGFASVTLTY